MGIGVKWQIDAKLLMCRYYENYLETFVYRIRPAVLS